MNRLTQSDAFSKRLRYASALLVLSSGAAFAQEDDEAIEEIQGFTVVGSNIQRLDTEPVSPVINITRESLDATGFSTVGDAIRALPIVSGQSLSTTDAGTSFTPGVSSVNLRGLGNNNTLALLNGRRVAPYPTPGFNGFQTVVDLNAIPASAIESIQVLKDGASAIYGSDAVAGVISVNLTKAYDGLTTEVSIGNTLDTDSFEKNFFAIGGASSGKTNLVFTVDYGTRESMDARDIEWTNTPNGEPFVTSNPPGFEWLADARSSANITANVRGIPSNGGADPIFEVDGDGNRVYRVGGVASGAITDADDEAGDTVIIGYDPILYPQLLRPGVTTGEAANIRANQLFPTGQASLRGFPEANGFDALPGPGTFLTTADFEPGNKFYNYQEAAGMFPKTRQYGFYTRLTYAVTNTMDVYLEGSFRRTEVDIGSAPTPAFFVNENGKTRDDPMVLPASNPYNPFGIDLTDVRWRIIEAGQRVNETVADTPRIVAGLEGELPFSDWRFDTGFLFTKTEVTNTNAGTVFDNRMQEALEGVDFDGEMVYANPFGRNDQRILDYMIGNNPNIDSFEVWSYDFKANGTIADLGDMGEIKAAFGAEYRYEELASVRTAANRDANIVGGSESTSVFGNRDVTALFTEVSVPLFDLVEFQAAVRYEDYSDFGDTTKPKIGFKAEPIEGILFRAAYGQSFRAPDMPFLYSAGSTSFTSAPVADAARPSDPPTQIKTLGGGNPDLMPEETDSIYAGLVVDLGKFVDVLDGLSFQIDFWRFEQDDVISRTSATTIVRNATDPFYSQFITRLPPAPGETVGIIEFVSTQWQNLDQRNTQGWDFSVSYVKQTENLGEFRTRLEVTYVDVFETSFLDDNGDQQWSQQAGDWLLPRVRGSVTLGWRKGDWAASVFLDYVGEHRNDLYDAYESFGIFLGDEKIDDYIRVNPQIAYSGLWDSTFTLGVRNVFNSTPPLDPSDTTLRSVGVVNIEPRFVYLRWQKDW